jgi:hypothetical protein
MSKIDKQKVSNYLNEHARSVIDLDQYRKESFDVGDYSISQVLDDVIVVKFLDTTDEREVMRGGIALPTAFIERMWRLGIVLMVGPNCKDVKVNDLVVWPGDKGIQVKNLTLHVNDKDEKISLASFLAESRIFGICKKIEQNESKPRTIKKTSSK